MIMKDNETEKITLRDIYVGRDTHVLVKNSWKIHF